MNDKKHILAVDDDSEIRSLLSKYLEQNGFKVSTARNGSEMLSKLEHSAIDLVILDIMMPGEDGLSLTSKLRSSQNFVPIIMLTAADEDIDKIIGLEMGADDYLAKPFNPRELVARIKAIFRRNDILKTKENLQDCEEVEFAGYRLNLSTHKLYKQNDEIVLSSGEFELLYVLIQNYGKILSREKLLDLTKGIDASPFDRSIDIQIARLRKKIENNTKKPEIIITIRGGGYSFAPEIKKVKNG